MEPDEVFLGFGCPVTTVWPNDVYDFTYPTYACGIVNKVRRNTSVYGPFLGPTKWKL